MPIHVHYATTSDGVSVAYWAMGEGPALVIPPIIATSHLELEWQIPSRRAAYEGLARGARGVRYDCPSIGMCPRPPLRRAPPGARQPSDRLGRADDPGRPRSAALAPDSRHRARHGRRLGPLRPRPRPHHRRLGRLERAPGRGNPPRPP